VSLTEVCCAFQCVKESFSFIDDFPLLLVLAVLRVTGGSICVDCNKAKVMLV